MKIGLRGGHSPNCKGAMGILDEQFEVRRIYSALAPMLQAAGHTIINCNSDAGNVNQELNDGTYAANAAGCDLFASIHMNAAAGDDANGTEVLLYDSSNLIMNQLADNICNRFAQMGFNNRGVKFDTGLHDLNASSMPGMIIETLFCTGSQDASRYLSLGPEGIAKLIAEAITGNAQTTSATKTTTTTKKGVATMYCTYKITDLDKDKVYFFNGEKSYPLEHPDELKILQQIYLANNGHALPHYNWTSKAPWFARLKGAVTGEAPNFFAK